MSSLQNANGDDYPEAAAKMLEDADILFTASRYDGSGYFSGYIVECALKTLIQVGKGTPHGHNLNELNKVALSFAAIASPRTARYSSTRISSLRYGNGGWRETIRYNAIGRVSENEAMNWLIEARRVYSETIGKMRIDGVIT